MKVDGQPVDIRSKAGDSLHYGSVITLAFSDRPAQPTVVPVSILKCSERQAPAEDVIRVFIADDYSIPVPMGFLSSKHPLESLSEALSVRLSLTSH